MLPVDAISRKYSNCLNSMWITCLIFILYYRAIKTILFISMITDYNKTVKDINNKKRQENKGME